MHPMKFNDQINDILTIARSYYELGFTPLPIMPRSKKPVCEWGWLIHERPSWETLEKLWQEAIQKHGNNLNIATVLGRPHGICALDIDDPNKFKVARKLVGLTDDELRTWATKSHRGGALFFKYPDQTTIRTHKRQDDWGAELYGDGHYVLLPPSIHPEGTQYAWIVPPDKGTLKPLPQIILTAFGVIEDAQMRTTKHTKHLSDEHIEFDELPSWAKNLAVILQPYWIEGQRHDLALSLAGVFAKCQIPYNEAKAFLTFMAELAEDRELKDRLRALDDTYDRMKDGDQVLAWAGLARHLPDEVIEKIRDILPKPETDITRYLRPKHQTTDLANAERFVKQHSGKVLFVQEWEWLFWDGKRWNKYIGEQQARLLAFETVQSIYHEAASALNAEDRDKLFAWAKTSENAHRINAMLDLAKPFMTAYASEFDKDPYLLNCLNGVVDLRTGNLIPHDPNLKLTKLAPVNYNPDAPAPTWERFMEEVFMGDYEVIEFIQCALGYSLTGDVSEDKLFICYGTGANGKSTLLRTIQRILGDYAKTAVTDILLSRRERADAHPTGLADLAGSRFVVAYELDPERHLATGLVKAMTGRDRLKARFMRKDYFEFEPTFKIWLATNHKPTIADTTHAMWRRIVLIPFNAVFIGDKCDPKMPEKLWAERDGILAWLVQGCLKWQREGLKLPKAVQEATEEYKTQMDVLQEWIEERCETGKGYFAPFSELYDDYVKWCETVGYEPITKRAFALKLDEKGFNAAKAWVDGVTKAIRKDIRLRKTEKEIDTLALFEDQPAPNAPETQPATEVKPDTATYQPVCDLCGRELKETDEEWGCLHCETLGDETVAKCKSCPDTPLAFVAPLVAECPKCRTRYMFEQPEGWQPTPISG